MRTISAIMVGVKIVRGDQGVFRGLLKLGAGCGVSEGPPWGRGKKQEN
jgi:hypothetical protein